MTREYTRLLLVEDDEDDYLLTHDLLEEVFERHFQLDWVQNADDAIECMARHEHDLCLLDYRLGHSDGIELLQAAKRIGFQSPIIMLTGQDDSELDAVALRHGAVDYLSKSDLTPTLLARAIRYALSRREMERERLERIRAETENQSKSRFLAHLSHELRTPLAAILGYTDVLLQQSNAADDRREPLLAIRRNGQHLRSLLNDVLDLSRIETGRFELEFCEVALEPFLSEVFTMMRASAEEKGLRLRISAVNALPALVRTDPVRLRQILINLLGNAIKFSTEGSVELRVRSSTAEDAIRLHFDIQDQGPGVAAENLQKLFQPFSRVGGQTGVRMEGSGLGLLISRKLARHLGGDITVCSEPGVGSTFSVVIEAEQVDASQLVELDGNLLEEFAAPISIPEFSGRLLIADDHEDLRNLFKIWLEKTGAAIETAANGSEVLTIVNNRRRENQDIHLILMDIQMPGLDGNETTGRLREAGFDLPIIALTAAAMKGAREQCLARGFSDFLSKPVHQQQLYDTIAAWLPNRTSQLRLLLVEDNWDAGQALAEILRLLSWDVRVAVSGAEALEMARVFRPHIAFLDLNLPDMSGYELAGLLSRTCTDGPTLHAETGGTGGHDAAGPAALGTPIPAGQAGPLLVSLSGEVVERQAAIEAGFIESLVKPIDLATLRETLQRLEKLVSAGDG